MTRKYVLKKNSSRRLQYERVEREVLRGLRRSGKALNVNQLMGFCNHSQETVRQHLASLMKAGYVGKRPKDDFVYFIIQKEAPPAQ